MRRRLPDPTVHLAALGGIVFPFALATESPIVMLLTATTALGDHRQAYTLMYRFMMIAGGLPCLLHPAYERVHPQGEEQPTVASFAVKRTLRVEPLVLKLLMKNPQTKYPKPGSNEHSQTHPGLESKMNTTPVYDDESYQGTGKLEGKKVVITGADSGIGRAVALRFAREGADVLLHHLDAEEEDAKATAAQVEDLGRKAVSFSGDFTDLSQCQKLVERAKEEFGEINVLVNNAGLQRHFSDLDDITSQDFEEIYRVNVVAPFELVKRAVPLMPEGGSIINTVSVQAYDPSFMLLPYACSKGAFTELTKALAAQLIDKGIRVNAVAPGPIWSPLNTHASPEEKLKQFGEGTPIGRPGQPVELAPVYLLLASDEGSYLTGEVYGVTGGGGVV